MSNLLSILRKVATPVVQAFARRLPGVDLILDLQDAFTDRMQEEQIQTLQCEVALLARQVDDPETYRRLVESQLASIRAEMREELARNTPHPPSDGMVEERLAHVRETLLDLPRNATLAKDTMQSVGRSFSSQETMRVVPRDIRDTISRTLFPRPEETTNLRSGDPVPEWRRWKLVKPLGRGGFGEVWLATHEINGRLVAVKFADDPTKAKQLEREIEAVRRLVHPHIVPLEDADLDANPAWVGFEYVSGGTLTEWILEAPRSVDEIVTRLDEILQALAHAHEQGVWHRDVKPDNVLIDASGRARLTDFGIGRIVAEDQKQRPPRSPGRSMAISGTTLYMPPEVLNGFKPADERSDVYAFGILSWQLLTGDPGKLFGVVGWEEDLETAGHSRFREFLRSCLHSYENRFANASVAMTAFRACTQAPSPPVTTQPPSIGPGLLTRTLKRLVPQKTSNSSIRPITDGSSSSTPAQGRRTAPDDSVASTPEHMAPLHRTEGTKLTNRLQSTLAKKSWWKDPDACRSILKIAATLQTLEPLNSTLSTARSLLWEKAPWCLLNDEDVYESLPCAETFGFDVWSVHWSPTAPRLCVAGDTTNLALLDITLKEPPKIIHTDHSDFIRTARFSPDGRSILTASADGTARIFCSTTGQLIRILPHPTRALTAEWAPDGKRAVVGGDDGVLLCWIVDQLSSPARLDGHEARIFSIAMSPDGQFLASVGEDRRLRRWSLASLGATGEPIEHPAPIRDACFSHDGSTLATACDDGAARVFNIVSGDAIILEGSHREIAFSAKLLLGGEHLVTCGEDGQIRIWDLNRRSAILSWPASPDWLRTLSVSEDCTFIAAGGDRRHLVIWKIRPRAEGRTGNQLLEMARKSASVEPLAP